MVVASHDHGLGPKLLVALAGPHPGLARIDKIPMVIAMAEVVQLHGLSKAELRTITEGMVHHLAATRLPGSRLLLHLVATMGGTVDILATTKVGMLRLLLLGCQTCCSSTRNSKRRLLHRVITHHHLLTGMLRLLPQVMRLPHLHQLKKQTPKGRRRKWNWRLMKTQAASQ